MYVGRVCLLSANSRSIWFLSRSLLTCSFGHTVDAGAGLGEGLGVGAGVGIGSGVGAGFGVGTGLGSGVGVGDDDIGGQVSAVHSCSHSPFALRDMQPVVSKIYILTK